MHTFLGWQLQSHLGLWGREGDHCSGYGVVTHARRDKKKCCRQVDDPEVLWSQSMREEEMLPAVHGHLGAFPLRLQDRTRSTFEYSPMPPMSYKALKGELWCYRYYLRKLCSPEHANHPIVEHVRFRNVRAVACK